MLVCFALQTAVLSKVAHMCFTRTHILLQGYFECIKIILNTKRSKVSHTGFTSSADSQISICFYSTASPFPVAGHLGEVHQMTPIWPWTPRSETYPICILQLSQFQSILLYGLTFLSYWPLTSSPNDLKMTLNTQKIKGSHTCSISTDINISISNIFETSDLKSLWWKVHRVSCNYPWVPRFTVQTAIFRVTGHFGKCTKSPQNDLELQKGQRYMYPQMCSTTTPESQISIYLALWPAIFKLRVILRKADWMTSKWF